MAEQTSDALDTDLENSGINLDNAGNKIPPTPKNIIAGQATEYVTISLRLRAGDAPIPLLNIDPSRVRALVKASDPNVFIGPQSELMNVLPTLWPNAFPLPIYTGAADELRNIDEVYVAYRPVEGLDPNAIAIAFALVERLTVPK